MTIDTLHGLPLKPAELFGGAITTVIPESFVDASDFREVPDNQEVFVSMSDDDADVSIIVDILERVEPEGAVSEEDEDMKAMEVHFADVLAERRGKLWSGPEKVVLDRFPNTPVYTLVGTVSAATLGNPIAQSSTEKPPFTALLITVIRIKEKTTDMVVTVNVPFVKGGVAKEESSIAAPEWTGGLCGETSGLLKAGLAVRDKVVGELRVRDWGLFGEE